MCHIRDAVFISCILLLAILFFGCSTDLRESEFTFTCGPDQPCADGYDCVDHPAHGEKVCVAEGTTFADATVDGPDRPDAADGADVNDDADAARDADVEPDGDDVGEAYDPTRDHDGDSVPSVDDNCPFEPNSDQADTDGDGRGDVCDNCPNVANYDQTDTNGDGHGDACSDTPVGDICLETGSEFSSIPSNLYIVFDRSGSMVQLDDHSESRMERLKRGLDTVAEQSASSMRFGVMSYPGDSTDECTAPGTERLVMGTYSASVIKSSYANVTPSGTTPTGGALYQVRENGLVDDSTDSLDRWRAKAVVLITDGEPNDACGTDSQVRAAEQAELLYNAGIPVYVVGFEVNSTDLVEVAQAGGTSNFYPVNDGSTLSNTLNDISDEVVSCSYRLDEEPEDEAKIWVELDGSAIREDADDGFTYDTISRTITLHGDACDTLRDASSTEGLVTVRLGCATECADSGEEVCDYVDNDCDGVVDEGCPD